jgi:hypothetical protein
MSGNMSEQEFQDALAELMTACNDWLAGEGGDDEHVQFAEQVSTFAESGVLTRNKGLCVTMADGSEFQLTIVRSY